MALIRPDFWIPHLSVYAFGVVLHKPQDNPDTNTHTVAPLDYVVAIGIAVGLFTIQASLLRKLWRQGSNWYFGKLKQVDSLEARGQSNRVLLSLLTCAVLGVLTLVSCILLFANFMMRIWALGFIVDVRSGGAGKDDRVNCSLGTATCLIMKPSFGISVEGLEQATAFMMQILVLMVSGLLVLRSTVLLNGRVWLRGLTGVLFVILVANTVIGIIAAYRNPYELPRQPGWLYYRYQSNDPSISTQNALARVTPTVSSVAVIALNLVFTIAFLGRTGVRSMFRLSGLLVDCALLPAVVGISTLFIPVYGAKEDRPLFYMRLARYSLRTLWVALLIIAPQLATLRDIRANGRKEKEVEENTITDSESGYTKGI